MCKVTPAAHAKAKAMAEETRKYAIEQIKQYLARQYTSKNRVPPNMVELERLARERFDSLVP